MRNRSGAIVTAFAMLAPVLVADNAWAAASISPTSGPSGTQISVTDPDCRNQDNNSISFGVVFSERVGGELVARSPQGGKVEPVGVRTFGSSAPSIYAISGPPGLYTLEASCRSLGTPSVERSATRFTYDLTAGTSAPVAPPTAAPETAASSEPTTPPSTGAVSEPASAGLGLRETARNAELAVRDRERNAELAQRERERNAELAARDHELAAREREVAQREVDRNAEVAARDKERNAELAAREQEIAQREIDRNAELAARDRVLAERNAEANSR